MIKFMVEAMIFSILTPPLMVLVWGFILLVIETWRLMLTGKSKYVSTTKQT